MSVTNSVVRSPLEPCGQPDHEDCGVRTVLERLGERWTVMTIAELVGGPKRFRQLERALDEISQRMLTLTVRRLERDGLISRTVEPTVPPAVTYELTERGRSLAVLVGRIVEWSKLNKEPIERSQQEFDMRHQPQKSKSMARP